MKRNRWVTGSFAVMVLTLAACSDGGAKTLSEDDFISEMEAICRTASREIDDLDASDDGYVGDIVDIIQTGLDDFAKLKPPKPLEGDFDDFVANLEDQLNEAEDLADALKDEDTDAAEEASANLGELAAEGDSLAEDIGADRCVGVGESSGAIDTTTDETTPAETTPEETTVNTPLPIDTTPVETSAPETSRPPITDPPATEPTPTTVGQTEMTEPPVDPDATGEALDASEIWAPPSGYEWGVLDTLEGVITPSVDPTLAPILVAYSAGIVHSTSNEPSAIFYVTEISSGAWTPEEIDAYFAFSFGDGGSETSTPGGLPARTKLGAADGLDAALAWLDGAGIAVIAPEGTDLLSLIDDFYNANVMDG